MLCALHVLTCLLQELDLSWASVNQVKSWPCRCLFRFLLTWAYRRIRKSTAVSPKVPKVSREIVTDRHVALASLQVRTNLNGAFESFGYFRRPSADVGVRSLKFLARVIWKRYENNSSILSKKSWKETRNMLGEKEQYSYNKSYETRECIITQQELVISIMNLFLRKQEVNSGYVRYSLSILFLCYF